ncbi:hypothetical protein [Chondromyces crocatus]|uniref:Uncharacterized protein n=1 Tax=Chondromyces crocatus TaxID=52 RepID=A0A0K1EPQ2_CHOCO|nr:hypothetical protein [Chondromyces crocatus]AKT42583.1 uncharacterized protein CMC5_068100 [Chondromyces crocatus]
MRLRRLFARLLTRVRRASDITRRVVASALLVLVYVLVLPWFALALRLRRPRPSGWRLRHDPTLATLERLRSPF